jgi:hypothetical protein
LSISSAQVDGQSWGQAEAIISGFKSRDIPYLFDK